MGNHGYECPTCGEQLAGLSGGHGPYCPGENPSQEELHEYSLQVESLKGGCVVCAATEKHVTGCPGKEASEEKKSLFILGLQIPVPGKLRSFEIETWDALTRFERSKNIKGIIAVENACDTLNLNFEDYTSGEQLVSYIVFLQAKSRMEQEDGHLRKDSEGSDARFAN